MKLILPIAGVGKRLRPFTFSKPKGFVKIAGSRGVDHILQKIHSSIPPKTPLCLITGYKNAQIEKYLNENYSDEFNIGYVEQVPVGYQGDVPYFSGLGHAILITRDWYNRQKPENYEELDADDTLVFLSDMIPVKDYRFIIETLIKPDNDGVIGTMIVPDEKTQFYGIVETNSEGIITDMKEKPKITSSNQAISGVYAFKAKTMHRLYEIMDEQYQKHTSDIEKGLKEQKEFQFTPSLQQLVEEGFKIKSEVFTDGILDFGRPEALLNGNRILLEAHQSHIKGPIKKIEDSIICDPCAIGSNCEIIRSVIGPYVSLGQNCKVIDCNLKNAVVGDNCEMKNIITRESIIGDNVKIESIIKDHITLGDNSYLIEL